MKKYFHLILFASAICACTETSTGIFQDDEINPLVKTQIQSMNDVLISSLKNGNAAQLRSLMSLELKQESDETESFVQRTQSIVESGSFEVVHAFYVVNKGSNEPVAIRSDTSINTPFEIRYQALTKESFVSILKPKREGDDYWVFALYGKYDEQWKLNVLQFGRQSIAGMNALEHFKIAKAQTEKGHLINAINRMVLASAIMNPAEAYFEYVSAETLKVFHDSLMQRALNEYPMPITLDTLSTRPAIFKLMPQRVKDEICTMVKYKTALSLSDTVALKAENALIHNQVKRMFPGIAEDVSYVFYRAYNDIPVEGSTVPYFGFVKEVQAPQPTP